MLAVVLVALPFVANALVLDLANQVLLVSIGAVALMLLTGFAGQISLGHAGLLAAGAFTTGILFKESPAPFWVTLPASAVVGALIGLVFGLPSLRLRGLYLAVSTLALHFMVIHAGQEYETRRGHSSGVVIDPPSLAGYTLQDGRAWYFVLLAASVATVLLSLNLLQQDRPHLACDPRPRGGGRGAGHPCAVREAVGLCRVVHADLGGRRLFAYYRGFVSAEAFSLFLTIQYVATVIIGGIGSVLGALLGTLFVVLFPYGIEALMNTLGLTDRLSSMIFAINYAAFGVAMILFLVFEPQGLVGIWRRVQAWFLLWPFKQKPLGRR